MPLEKQNIPISFGQGIDTKTDPNLVIAGKLISLQNVTFSEAMAFNKRNGYQKLASLSQGINLSTFQNELVAFDGSSFQSYSPVSQTMVNKGSMVSVDLSVSAIARSNSSQTFQDSAYHLSGLFLFVWKESGGSKYAVYSSTTGNQLVSPTSLEANAVSPRAWSIGNYLLVTYMNSSTNHLRYVAIPILSLSNPIGPTDISTQVNTSNAYYDGIVDAGNLYLSWNASDIGGAVRTTFIDAVLNQHLTNVQTTETADQAMGVFRDSTVTPSQIYVVYANSSNLKYFILAAGSLGTVLSPTIISANSVTIENINGFATSGMATIFYQTHNTYSFSTTRSDFISEVTADNAGAVGSPTVFLRSVGIVSKCFLYSGLQYMVVAYNGALQPTYFVVDENGKIIAKIAYTNGGGYANESSVCSVNQITPSQFQFAYLFKDILNSQQGSVYTGTGVNSVVVTMSSAPYQTIELGNNLNMTGGFAWIYDGLSPVENNFHIYPEDFSATTGSSGITPLNIAPNTYSYVPIYEWTDNQGNIHRSGYGTPLSVTVGGGTSGITVSVPTLRLTNKQNTSNPVNIALYRTAPSDSTGIYYQVTSISAPVSNDSSVDSIDITDSSSDNDIVGNNLLYTTGAVVQDSGGPAMTDVTLFRNRIFGISSENRKSLWYSKQVLQGVPVEFSQSFTFYVDPRFGDASAIAVMDDKLIIFKSNAIFYTTGEGPDNTGANNDFAEAIFITSVVGCTNKKSIVLTQDGLMFQSNKGIWLLDRSLGVSYIGAQVEAYNSYMVTSAVVVPGTTQVRFTITNGTALVYDYFFRQWSVFTNHDAAGAVIFENLYTYLSPGGIIMQEAPGIYTDNGVPFYRVLSTSWLSFSGFQGYMRAYRVFLKSQFISPHILTVSIAYDYNPNATESCIIKPTDLAATAWGDDPYWGSDTVWGGTYPNEQYRINLSRQKCQAIQIQIQEGVDTSNVSYGAASTWEGFGVVMGLKKGNYPRLPASLAVTG